MEQSVSVMARAAAHAGVECYGATVDAVVPDSEAIRECDRTSNEQHLFPAHHHGGAFPFGDGILLTESTLTAFVWLSSMEHAFATRILSVPVTIEEGVVVCAQDDSNLR